MAKIRYIDNYDAINGFWGVAVSVWFQGCPHRCYKCFNSETWNENDVTVRERNNIEVAKEILEELDRYYPKTLSILGGESLAPYNINDLSEILKYVKTQKKDLKIALWTGYEWEDVKNKEVIRYIDVIVVGKYIDDLHRDYKITKNILDKKRGSTNQRVIDVKKSLKENKVVIINFKKEDLWS